MPNIDISTIIPAYNEERNVQLLYNKLKIVLDSLNKKYEIIFVDDGSSDKTFDILKKIHRKDKNVKVIQFQRNFGKAAALSTGFNLSKGNILITIDADLQDDPSEIPKFLEKLKEGYDLVTGWRYRRKDPITKKIASKIFNFLVRSFTKIRIHDSDCNFRILKKNVVKDLKLYSGLYRFIPSFAHNQGFKVSEVKVIHYTRKYGKSKYGTNRLIKGFFDLITVTFLLSYTKRPLHLFGLPGFISIILGTIICAYLTIIRLFFHQLIGDRPLLLLGVLLLVLGVQFVSLGLLGEMIINVTQKPEDQYVIEKKLS